MWIQWEIQLIAVVVAVACALPGCFLVLRRLALLSDAVSHAILVGIAAAFLVTGDLGSPFLIAGAALSGLATVVCVELLHRTRLVREDAAIGLVFPTLFAIGVLLIARNASHAHLDTDSVLTGELVFAALEPFEPFGFYVGPRVLWVMLAILALNVAFIALFYKELKLASFDPALAVTLGLAPTALHYALMALVSVTAVGAFDAVGSPLVVALMIAPPAAAYLLTDRLSLMLLWSALLGVVSAVSGYWVAHALDASIAGSMATMTGVLFALALFLAPERGLLAAALRRLRQRWEFPQRMLVIHLFNHEGLPEAERESRVAELHEHLQWKPARVAEVVRRASANGLVRRDNGHLLLTDSGRLLARLAFEG
jgi:manganese/zinc/iron transport system permease protein